MSERPVLRLIKGAGTSKPERPIPPASLAASAPVTCANCGVAFWLTEQMKTQRLADHGHFYCPNGHVLAWKTETEADALRKERDAAQAELQRFKKRLPKWFQRWMKP